ncbi:uncharacterized protein EV154DRAFT_478305 [Mucor mucedo]|uniref:uncharacterized protein n=1 Tax=Mucor mucedo TaxID=29922 RepID=UPI0022204DB9|nr:uncharacterized protein EV154DRAFT_478305 [Mucor mucedo]KAI7894632.1 hypothetical protein EV154DRAFT_478305 [Mucor mucedo]
MPADIYSVWGPFKTDHADIIFKKKLQAGTSQFLDELGTTYQNCIVEAFEDHLLRYFYYRLQNIFVRLWILIPLNLFQKSVAISTNAKGNSSMSATPEKAYKCLEYILKQYEQNRNQYHPFDVQGLPLPRLFSILPSLRCTGALKK